MTGCTLAPNYTRPDTPVPAAWPAGPSYKPEAGTAAQPVADIPWQDFLTDDRLRRTIALALENNRDLRVAALTVERAQAQYQIKRADLIPRVDGTAGATFQRVPEGLSSSGRAVVTDQYSVGLGISSYEVDLFGRVRSLKDQALEQYLSTRQARRSVQIALVAQTALAWLNLAADREHLLLAQETLVNQEAYYGLIRSRYEAGIASALDLNQARSLVETARLDIARYTTLTAQGENALAQIVGAPLPAELLPRSLSDATAPLREVSPGLPSDVLLNRPDILQAEGDLRGANASIGAARAAFFPRITLMSSVGLGSNDLAALFTGNSFAWSFAPRVTLPIFDGGANTAGLRTAEVDRDLAVARYEKAIQAAFREVADTLAQRGTVDQQLAAQQSLTDATSETYQLSRARYDTGLDSYLQVLDSQRSNYAARQNLISVRLARLTNQVTLYKVLGGGTK